MNDLINQQRERIAELEEQLKTATASWNYEAGECAKAEQRAESAEQRVKELEEVNDIMLTRLMAAALALASGRKCPDASEALNKFAIEIMSLTLNAAVDVDVIDILDTENHAKVSARFNELRAKGGDE